MAKIIDVSGQKFNMLIAIETSGRDKHGQTLWKCLCDCGNTTKVRSYHLRNGQVKSCGCLRKKPPPNKLPYGVAAQHKLYNDYKKRANYDNILFEMAYDDFINLTKKTCEYCGRFPFNIIEPQNKNSGSYTYNGIDRKNNDKGYTKDNCITCCEICNRAKKDLSLEDFFSWINRLIEYNS